MNYSNLELNNIVKTLPIGYYVGRDINVEVKEDIQTSNYEIMNDKINISLNQIKDALSEGEENEEAVRTMLYHEVSHALLTPKELTPSRMMNIFEDERIETLLNDYYLNTNFKKQVKLMNHFHGEKPTNPDSAFYHVVRFRQGKKEFLDRVDKIIKNNNSLISNSGLYECEAYIEEVRSLYKDIVNDFKKEQKQEKQKQEKQDKQNSMTSTENCSEKNENSEEQDESQENEQISEEYENNEEFENDDEELENNEESDLSTSSLSKHSLSKEEVKKLFSKVVSELINKQLIDKVELVLKQVSSVTKNNGSAINSYSGVFNPRSVIRDDYKYFVQQNRQGHQKAFSKNHLSIFIDTSGSYYYNENKTNQILYALRQYEKQNPTFTFDVVTMDIGEKLQDKSIRQIKVINGRGNKLDSEIFKIFNELQLPSTNNYNIVLFDGYALSDGGDAYNFSAFNTSNTTIISDNANKCNIKKYCTSAKKVITENYVNELENNVLQALQNFSR